jgi:hypothetical protein
MNFPTSVPAILSSLNPFGLSTMQIVALAASAVVFVVILVYIIVENSKNNGCSKLGDLVKVTSAIGASDNKFNDILGNFYVKSSYNSCAMNEWKNDFVDTCALKRIIDSGCRFLDFEIYDVHGEPVVATSNVVKYGSKETYNHVPLTDVLKMIEQEALSSVSNSSDPLFLNFRFATQHTAIFDKVAVYLTDGRYTLLTSRLLEAQYSAPEIQKKLDKMAVNATATEVKVVTIQDLPLLKLRSKVIILADYGKLNNREIPNTRFYELVNVCGGDFQSYTANEMLSMGADEVRKQAYYHLAMATPDTWVNYKPMDDSADAVTPFSNGIQFCAMNFQNNDANLVKYGEFFKDFAFVNKEPDHDKQVTSKGYLEDLHRGDGVEGFKVQRLRRDPNANKVDVDTTKVDKPKVDLVAASGQTIYIP